MPTYQYRCEECGIVFDRFQHFSEEPVKVCPECHGPVHRVIHPVGVIFTGSGFYVTDHRVKSSTEIKTDSTETKTTTTEAAKKGAEPAVKAGATTATPKDTKDNKAKSKA